ncbi:hypothetical protein [Neptuniibacter sp. QD34_54]|uniref:hypothetical protein n=1 Tax=Neptuniibacter sp. QD34_54 TaxID=3398208 RepID=UPI0039F45C6B
MNIKTLVVLICTCLVSSPVFSTPTPIDDLLPPPDQDFLSCTGVFGETEEFRITWAPILEEGKNGPVKKYASDIFCSVTKAEDVGTDEPQIYGEIEVSPEALPARECPSEGDICSTTVPMSDLFSAVDQAVEDGDLVLDEGTTLDDYNIACSAKVKGLNPPGKSQNHPQGIAPCDVVQASLCPAWSAEELADVGSHGAANLTDDEDISNAFYTGLYNDQEFGGLGNGLSINVAAFTGFLISSQSYVAHYSHQPMSIFPGSTTPDPEKDTVRFMDVTEEEYEACKQELIEHETNPS